MDVSTIIVNYNTQKLLLDTIASIKEKSFSIEYEIIVVDNNSIDDSVEETKSKFPDVKVILSKENVGFGRANNLGVKHAKGKYIFFLNSDTLLVNNAVKILFDFFENNPDRNLGIAAGNLFTKDMAPNFSYSTYLPNLWTHLLYRLYLAKFFSSENFNSSGNAKKVGQVIGADLMISKKLFDEIGGFDPFYFMYVEDTDMQKTITNMGYSIFSVPEAKIIHLQGSSSLSYQKLKWEIEGYKYYFKKFYNKNTLKKYLMIEKFCLRLRKVGYRLKGKNKYVGVVNQILKELN